MPSERSVNPCRNGTDLRQVTGIRLAPVASWGFPHPLATPCRTGSLGNSLAELMIWWTTDPDDDDREPLHFASGGHPPPIPPGPKNSLPPPPQQPPVFLRPPRLA